MKLVRGLLLTPVVTHVAMAGASVREEFVARMDAAMADKKRDARLTKRLMQIAQPLEPQPRFLEEYQDLDINMTEYALKYIGCQDVHQYSDELAQDDRSSTVLGMNRFVIVRLCPKDECSNYNRYGCNAGFGDYVIPMEDYLRTMAEEYFAEYQNYCETCYYCMVQASQQGQQQQQQQGDDAAQNNAGDDAQAAGDDGAAGDDAVKGDDAANGDDANGGRFLANDDAYYYKNADFYNNMDNNANADQGNDECANYYNACDDFRTACKDYSQYANNMEAYFECSEFKVGNQVGYLGPHCRSDGKTIGIGLYKDQYCNEYNSDITNLSSMTGMDLGDENLKAYYSQKCISCLASDGYDLNQDGNNQVTAVCGALYEMSAKCNKYMGNAAGSASSSQNQDETSVCTFIHNLITNSYDEYGHIHLDNGGWQAYIPDVRSMSKFQKYTMSFSVILVVSLFGYACYLHRKISKAKYAWYPKGRRGYSSRNFTGGQQPILERMHSGIIQGRSRSGGTAELQEGGIFA